MTPPKSKRTARIKGRRLSEEVARDRVPQLGGEAERVLIHPLVVAVEHGGELVEVDALTEQAEAVGGHTETPEEAGVGGADGQERDARRARGQRARHPLQAVPER